MSAAIKAVAAKTAKMTACALASGLAASLSAASLAQTSEGAHAPRWQLNMPEGVTALSREVYELHMLVFWVCVAIGVLVYGLMAVSMVLHRRARGVKPAQFHDSLRLELLWTIVPAGILVALFIPSMVTLAKIYDNSDSDLDILVTGYQWKWEYHYLGDDNDFKFLSTLRTSDSEMRGKTPKGEYYLLDVDKPLVIPVHKKVRFLITAKDVLHAWWVPDFAVKQDAIPGFINEAWVRVDTPGVYRGQCTELCGKDHGFHADRRACGAPRRVHRMARPPARRRRARTRAGRSTLQLDRARRARSGRLRDALRQLPPAHRARHSRRLPGADRRAHCPPDR